MAREDDGQDDGSASTQLVGGSGWGAGLWSRLMQTWTMCPSQGLLGDFPKQLAMIQTFFHVARDVYEAR